MGFIRVKKIKEKEYAYLVENKWTEAGPRQNVKKYLGRVHRPEKINNEETAIAAEDFHASVKEIIKKELKNHGFCENLSKADFKIDLEKRTVNCKKKNAVIAMNEGFLCEFTMKKALDFDSTGTEEQAGLKLATVLVESGLKVSEQTFISLFNKIYKGEVGLSDENG